MPKIGLLTVERAKTNWITIKTFASAGIRLNAFFMLLVKRRHAVVLPVLLDKRCVLNDVQLFGTMLFIHFWKQVQMLRSKCSVEIQ